MTVAFFSLFGFIFLMTQYFQFVKRLRPAVDRRPPAAGRDVGRRRLGASARKLAVRFGTKLVVTAGLLLVAAVLRVGRRGRRRRHELRHDRGADGAATASAWA